MAAEALEEYGTARRLLDSDRLLAGALIAPAIIYIAALMGVPLVLSIYYSFSDLTTGGTAATFVGLANFRALIGDPIFLRTLFNTFLVSGMTLLIVLVLGTIQAELLIRPFRGKWLVRFLILLPWTAPVSLSVIGWLWMLDSIFSPIDWFLRQASLLGHPGALLGPATNLYWLGSGNLPMASIILVNVWRILPLGTVIVLAGLNSIPQEIQEQALVDGAGYFRRLFQVILPMMLPIFGIAVLFTFIFTFADMVVIYILTRGGPANSTHVLTTLAFFTGVQGGSLGQGAAIALFMFPVLAALSAGILVLIRRREV
ncbi:carbohydrate ABC transporter permease [Sinorhizobium saheli]|uniref:ABC transporter permease n=1 Tax=Sinorhizobium saheli TaxID=36856 RepID=A0A178Y9W7_SINSA|nr:sugar ABC transporter permease [Sinorhizobium saheli]MQW90109.1 ABC transporter permease subunit [Sinorhizobium saheli]OAP43893.1 ABC transporter permease [Sinorhizobium saheli]